MKGLACLQKEETLEVCNKCSKGLVLKSESPFGAYYSEHPEVQKVPVVLYIPVKAFNECMETKIIRLRQDLKKEDSKLKMNYAHISLLNKVVPAVAFHASEEAEGDLIIEQLMKTGIKPVRKQKVKPYISLVQIRKFVALDKIAEGVFSAHEKFHYYLSIPKKLEWEDFRACVNTCRNSNNFPHFDAAQLSLFQYDNIEEFVRIYSQTAKNDDLIKMKEVLNKLYKNY